MSHEPFYGSYCEVVVRSKEGEKGKASFMFFMFDEDFNFVPKVFFFLFISLTFHKRFNVVIPIDAI